jgi:ubiquinone/menaquinone biosynthesis C-methylase UbiE
MNINPTDHVLHLSFDDEAFGRADVFCGMFNKRQVSNKTFKPLDYSAVTLPFKDKTFDVVYATNVLAYSHQPIKMINEIKRVCHRFHLRERSEFAEMLFGWENTRWIMDVVNNQLIIKNKSQLRCGRFGPLFHHYYANDPNFFDVCGKSQGLMSIAVDWFEEDDVVVYEDVQEEQFVVPTVFDDETVIGQVKEENSEEKKAEVKTVTTKKIKEVKTNFRPCQIEYFSDSFFTVGTVSDKIDVRQLKKL